MNKLIHNAINKFHNINLRCGMLALESESGSAATDDPARFKRRLGELLRDVAEDLKSSRQLLIEITTISSEKLDCYAENEHFFKMVEPILSIIEAKKLELENTINENKGPLSKKEIIKLLHVMEEKALACGVILKELRDGLIKSKKYKIEEA